MSKRKPSTTPTPQPTPQPLTTADTPPAAVPAKSKSKRASGKPSGGSVVDGLKAPTPEAAATTDITAPTPPTAARKRAKRTPPRIALVNKDEAGEIAKAVEDLPISKDHICWKRNGKLHELYFRLEGKTPTLFRAPADSPVDESGYRTKDASGNVTGVFHITETIRQLTGKRPAQIGIKLPKDLGAPKARVASPAEGKAAGEAKPRKKREGISGLDAAAQVLAKAKEPLSAKTIAQRAIAAGWKTNGATPHATLYAAMIREIAVKGKDSRFTKVDKGRFTAAGKGA